VAVPVLGPGPEPAGAKVVFYGKPVCHQVREPKERLIKHRSQGMVWLGTTGAWQDVSETLETAS
jgi:hypothetical protein